MRSMAGSRPTTVSHRRSAVAYPHPGEILNKEFLEPMGITKYQLSKAIHVPATRVGEIVSGARAITADTGLRLSRFFGMNDGFWIGLQIDHDLARTRDALGAELDDIEVYEAA